MTHLSVGYVLVGLSLNSTTVMRCLLRSIDRLDQQIRPPAKIFSRDTTSKKLSLKIRIYWLSFTKKLINSCSRWSARQNSQIHSEGNNAKIVGTFAALVLGAVTLKFGRTIMAHIFCDFPSFWYYGHGVEKTYSVVKRKVISSPLQIAEDAVEIWSGGAARRRQQRRILLCGSRHPRHRQVKHGRSQGCPQEL